MNLSPRTTSNSAITPTPGGWRLTVPAGPRGTYRLAQLDDYTHLPRRAFRWRPPLAISLRARVSAPDLPGTWGFGLWNDPFGFSLGLGGTAGRFPALPDAAWFFHASPPNYLSFRNDLPAQGFFAAAFRSPQWPPLLLALGLLTLPLVALRPVSRLLRRLAGRIIRQDAAPITVDVIGWHEYALYWQGDGCAFAVDGTEILRTPLSPSPPLGLVLWMDNQYAAWRPDGSLGYGTLGNPEAWVEIENLGLNQ